MDVVTGQILRNFADHTGFVKSVAFSPDGALVLSGSEDGTIKIWNAKTGELLLSLIGKSDGTWLAVTPEGFFAMSRSGSDLISIVHGLKVFSVDQFYQSLYRPDLVREKLKGDPFGLVREAATLLDLDKVLASGDAPTVRILSPADGATAIGDQVVVEVELADRGGNIGGSNGASMVSPWDLTPPRSYRREKSYASRIWPHSIPGTTPLRCWPTIARTYLPRPRLGSPCRLKRHRPHRLQFPTQRAELQRQPDDCSYWRLAPTIMRIIVSGSPTRSWTPRR